MKIETAIECLKYCKEQLTIERGSDFSGVEALGLAIKVLDLCTSKDPNYKVMHLIEDVECLDSVDDTENEVYCITGEKFCNNPSNCKDCITKH